MQIDYHTAILQSDIADLPSKKLAIKAILELVREGVEKTLDEKSIAILLDRKNRETDTGLQESIMEVLAYAGRTTHEVQSLLLSSTLIPQRTSGNAGILTAIPLLLHDDPDASDDAYLRSVVSRAHQFLPASEKAGEDAEEDADWHRKAVMALSSWMASKINQYRKAQGLPNDHPVHGLTLFTPMVRFITPDEVRHLQSVLPEQLGADQFALWTQKLLELVDRPSGDNKRYRILLTLFPIEQKNNQAIVVNEITRVLASAFDRAVRGRPTLSPEEQQMLAEQIRERIEPAVQYLANKSASHRYVVMGYNSGDFDQYPRIRDLFVELVHSGDLTHIALPIAPERQDEFEGFLQSGSEGAARKLFDRDYQMKWAFEALRPLMQKFRDSDVPLVLFGGNPSLHGELLLENEISRLAKISADDRNSRTLIPVIGYLTASSSLRSRVDKPSLPTLLEKKIGAGNISRILFFAHSDAWSADGARAEVGDFAERMGMHEPFGFDIGGTLVGKTSEIPEDMPYETDWDGMVILTKKDEGRRRRKAKPRNTRPLPMVPVMT